MMKLILISLVTISLIFLFISVLLQKRDNRRIKALEDKRRMEEEWKKRQIIERRKKEEREELSRRVKEAFASQGFHFVQCPPVVDQSESSGGICFRVAPKKQDNSTTLLTPNRDISDIQWERILEQQRKLTIESNESKVEESVKAPARPTITPELEKKLNEVITQLRLAGIPDQFIHTWLDEHVTLSRLTITKQFKIIFNDYKNVEVELGPLPKTVFLFFLKHPEGELFKCLQDYKQELMDIYGQLTACDDQALVEERINTLVNPIANSINEKCSVVKRAFVQVVGEAVAKHYCIVGRQGEPKKISIDRSLVIWE